MFSPMTSSFIPNTIRTNSQNMTKSWPNCKIFEPPVPNPPEPLCSGQGPYRANVAALALRNRGREILLGERADTPGKWQWPQGGLNPGETPEDGLARELREETGVSRARILYRFPFKLRYRFPLAFSTKFWPNIGQEQIYFVVELEEDVDLAASDGEFRDLKWTPLEDAARHATWFKTPLYHKVLEHLEKELPQIYPLPD